MIKKFNEYLMESEGTLTQEQKDWLDKFTEGSWRVNPSTGLVDVDGDFSWWGSVLHNLMGVRFGRVSGNFFCSYNELTSLEGAPQEVGGNFNCSKNKLTSLKGAPQEVKGDFYCDDNQITSLEGAPQKVKGSFSCYDNKLTSLEGSPQEIGRSLFCSNNKLTSLKGIPFISEYIDLVANPIWDLISPYWEQIKGMEMRSRNLVMQMIGQLENPTTEDLKKIMRSADRMDMI
jgi:hypothetical protein